MGKTLKRMKNSDRISGLFWLAVSIFMCFKSFQVGVGTIRSPGAGFVPFWAGVILALLTVFLTAQGFLHRGDSGEEIPIGRARDWIRILLFLLVLCLFVFVLQRIGYLLSTFGLMFCLLSMSEKMRWWVRALYSLVISTATYLVFNTLLGVQLPAGILG